MSSQMPTWEALIESWNAVHRGTIHEDAPTYFSATRLAQALERFIGHAHEIFKAKDPKANLDEMIRIAEENSGEDVLLELRQVPAADILGIYRTSMEYGIAATHLLALEENPVVRPALKCIQTVAAVTMDSLAEPEVALSNPFAHRVVLGALEDLQEALGISVESRPLRSLLHGMVRRDR